MSALDTDATTRQVLPEAPLPELRRRVERPRTDYWDFTTASWRRCAPAIPVPRSGD